MSYDATCTARKRAVVSSQIDKKISEEWKDIRREIRGEPDNTVRNVYDKIQEKIEGDLKKFSKTEISRLCEIGTKRTVLDKQWDKYGPKDDIYDLINRRLTGKWERRAKRWADDLKNAVFEINEGEWKKPCPCEEVVARAGFSPFTFEEMKKTECVKICNK